MQRRQDTLAAFKAKLRRGDVVLGMQHDSGSGEVMEVLGYSGFDYVLIDMEHSSYSITVAEEMVRAAEAVGLVPFIRVLKNDPHLIMQAMDAGALGVFVPHVMDRADCEAALSAMRYMPEGRRGKSAGIRAAGWGSADWASYQSWANSEPLLVPIIEDKEAVEQLEDILSVPGLELVSIGPGDLSQSYGAAGRGLRAEPVMAALERCVAFCEKRGIAVVTIPLPDLTNEWTKEVIAKGAKVVWYGFDLGHIGARFRQLAAVRS